MTDDNPDLEPIDLGAGAPYSAPGPGAGSVAGPYAAPPPSAPSWAPGWYADPWTAGQYRYWDGQGWSGETNRWGPSTAKPGPATDATDPWPSNPNPVAGGYGWPDGGSTGAAGPPAAPSRPRGPMIAGVVALVVVLVASGAIGYAINSRGKSKSAVNIVPNPAGWQHRIPIGACSTAWSSGSPTSIPHAPSC